MNLYIIRIKSLYLETYLTKLHKTDCPNSLCKIQHVAYHIQRYKSHKKSGYIQGPPLQGYATPFRSHAHPGLRQRSR